MEISIYNPLPYYSIVFLYTLFYIFCTYFHNPFITLWIVFGLLPLLDQLLSMDLVNPKKEQQREMKNLTRFKVPLVLTIMLDWVFLFWAMKELIEKDHDLLYKFGVFSVMVTLEGASINTSHELNHKINKFENILGTLNLSKSFYMHFIIEHNQGHHRNVATFDDPATSRLNESVYRFFPRTVINTYISSWEI